MMFIMITFMIAADIQFYESHPPSEMRQFRGVHLGVNLAGIFIFPIFTYIGIPLSLAKLHKHRHSQATNHKRALGAGILTLLVLTTVILLSVITANINLHDHANQSRCRKRAVLQFADQGATTTLAPTMSIVDVVDASTTSFETEYMTTAGTAQITTAWESTTTTRACWSFSVGGVHILPWGHLNNPTLLDEPSVIISVVVLALLAFALHVAFIVFADKIILKEIAKSTDGVDGVVTSRAPGGTSDSMTTSLL
jgi:hypothetical protein